MKRISILVVLSLFFAARANAEIQKSGPEVWPGKLMVGVRPLGMQLSFSDYGAPVPGIIYGIGDRVIYKLGLDIAGIVASFSKVTLWLGGEVNVGGRGNFAFIEPGVFVQVSLEKLVQKFPLVPLIRAGVSGPISVPYGYTGATLYGAFQLKVGGGAYYFLTKNIGVGADINFGFGPGFAKYTGTLHTGFAGFWDFTAGARFAF